MSFWLMISLLPVFRQSSLAEIILNIPETVTRDYVDTMIMRAHPEWRHILMHPWTPVDLTGEKLEHIIAPDSHFTVKQFCIAFPNFKVNEVIKVGCIKDFLFFVRKTHHIIELNVKEAYTNMFTYAFVSRIPVE